MSTGVVSLEVGVVSLVSVATSPDFVVSDPPSRLSRSPTTGSSFAGDDDFVGRGQDLAAEPRVHKAVIGDT